MSSGPARPFISVKFTPVGRTYSFLLPELALDAPPAGEAPVPPTSPLVPGDAVVVQGPEGRAFGTVTRGIPAMAERRMPPPESDATVVRKATRDDVVLRLKHQQREQEAQRICLMKIRERGLAMKLARVEQLFDGSRLIFYFTAEGRVDFRELVRDLAARVPHPHRDAADRRARRGADARRLRLVRPAPLLHDLPADVRAGLDQDGQAAEPEPQPVEAVGPVRTAEVLPALRAAQRARGCSTAAARHEGRMRRVLRQPPTGRGRHRAAAAEPAARAACGTMRPDEIGDHHQAIRRASGRRSRARQRRIPRVRARVRAVLYGRRGRHATLRSSRRRASRRPRAAPRYDAIVRAVDDAMAGRVDAIATAPINKEAFALAGLPWRGHTDLLAHLTAAPRVAMMFYAESLRVVLATVHIAAGRGAAALITRERLDGMIDLTAASLPRFGYRGAAPRARRAEPARRRARPDRARGRRGACARGRGVPGAGHRRSRGRCPPTRCSCARSRGEFDAVVACYHDQGLIPGEAAGVRQGGERHARAADRPHVGGSRHGVRHRGRAASPTRRAWSQRCCSRCGSPGDGERRAESDQRRAESDERTAVRARTGPEEHCGEPQGVPRLPHPRDASRPAWRCSGPR